MRKGILSLVAVVGIVISSSASALMQGGATLPEIFDDVIYEDSLSWMFHRYDRGSVYNVHVDGASTSGRSGTIHGNYTFNNGMRGWAKVVVINGGVNCLEFHDFAGTCRAWRRSESWPLLGRLIGEASRQNH